MNREPSLGNRLSTKLGKTLKTLRNHPTSEAIAFSVAMILNGCGGRSELLIPLQATNITSDGGTFEIPDAGAGDGSAPTYDAGKSDASDDGGTIDGGNDSGTPCHLLENVFVSPTVFNPAKQDVDVNFKSLIPNEFVKIVIEKDGQPVYESQEDQWKSETNFVEWTGQDNNLNFVSAGTYTVKVIAHDQNCTEVKTATLEAKAGGEYFCPTDTVCFNNIRSKDDFNLGKTGNCLDFIVVNNTASTADVTDLPGGISTPYPNGDAAPDAKDLINDDTHTPNFSNFLVTNAANKILLGPTQLTVNPADPLNDIEQKINFSDSFSVTPFTTESLSELVDVAANPALEQNQVGCYINVYPQNVTDGNGQSPKILVTPSYLVEDNNGNSYPSSMMSSWIHYVKP